MNRIYEELFILRPDITEEEVTPVIDQLRTVITNAGGTMDKEERWGVRKLAYRVEKRNEGFYVLLQFTAAASAVKEVERRLRVNDAVLKYMTVRIDDKLKWLEKRRKEREKRAARKPIAAPTPAAPTGDDARPAMPATPALPVPGAPGAPAAAATDAAPAVPPAVPPAAETGAPEVEKEQE
jgi:small subunit ribosomal protein S6